MQAHRALYNIVWAIAYLISICSYYTYRCNNHLYMEIGCMCLIELFSTEISMLGIYALFYMLEVWKTRLKYIILGSKQN